MIRLIKSLLNLRLLYIAFGWLTLVAVRASAAAAPETTEFEAKGLKFVEVRNISGFVKVHGAGASFPPPTKARVLVIKNEFSPTCRLIIERDDTKLVVHVKQGGFVNSNDCKVDLDVLVPRKISTDIGLGAGDIDVRDVEGDLKIKVGKGAVTGIGHFPDVLIEGGSGDVRVDGLAGSGVFKSGAANYELTFARSSLKSAAGSSPKSSVEISVATGRASLRFPKGTKVQTKLTAASGQVTNDLGESPNPDVRVVMKAASGDLSVKAY